MISDRKIEVVIPTYNGGNKFVQVANMLKKQIGIVPEDVLVIDSSSSDQTVKIARKAGFRVRIIDKKEFGHGKTRRRAVEQSDAAYIVFMTQDAVPATNDSIIQLCRPLMENKHIGVTYGIQLPTPEAGTIGNHARLFNYPPKSQMKTKKDIPKLGIKTIFCSDSFAAYNREYLLKIGNFMDVDFGEDTLATAKMIESGYSSYYNAEACVYHAHAFTMKEDFQRSIIIGELHQRYRQVFKTYGTANGEGLRFVKSEIKTLIFQGKVMLLPNAFFHNLMKFIGYHLGKNWRAD